MNDIADFINRVYRPVLGLILIVAVIAMIFAAVTVPDQFWGIVETVIGALVGE